MLAVVGADGHGIQLQALVIQHLLVGGIIGFDALHAIALEEGCRLAGNQVAARDQLDIGHPLVGINVRICDPAAPDDTDAQLAIGVDDLLDLLVCIIQLGIHFLCHIRNLLCIICFLGTVLYVSFFQKIREKGAHAAGMGSMPSTRKTPQYS